MDIKESIQLGQGFLHIENINGGVVNIYCPDREHTNIPVRNLERQVENLVSVVSKLQLSVKKCKKFKQKSTVTRNPENSAQISWLSFAETRSQRPTRTVDLSRNRHSTENAHSFSNSHETSRKTQYVANSSGSNCTVIPQKTCDENCNIKHTLGTERCESHTDSVDSACDLRLFSSERTSCSILKESEDLPIQNVFNPLDLRSNEESHETVSELKLHEPNICSPDCTSTKSFLQLAETCASRQEKTFSSSYPINDSSSVLARKLSSSCFYSENTSGETKDGQRENLGNNLSSPNNGMGANKEEGNEKFASESHSLRSNSKNLQFLNEACDVETEHNEVCELDSNLTNRVCQNECKHSCRCFNEVGKCSEKLNCTKKEFEIIKEANNIIKAKDVDNRQMLTSFGCNQIDDERKEMKSEEIITYSHVDDKPKIQTKDESFSLDCNTVSKWPDSEVKNALGDTVAQLTDESLCEKSITEKKSITWYSVSDGEESQVYNEGQCSKIPKVSDDSNEINHETCMLDDHIGNRAIPQSVLLNAANENGESAATDIKQKSSLPQSDGLPTSQLRTRSLSSPDISYTSYDSLHTKRVRTNSLDSGIGSAYSSSLLDGSEDMLKTKKQASLRLEPKGHKGTEKTSWCNFLEDMPVTGVCILVNNCFRTSKPIRIKPITEGSWRCRNVKSIHTNIEQENLATMKATAVVTYESEKGHCESNTSKNERNLSSDCAQTDGSNKSDIKRLFSSSVCEINKNGESLIDGDNEIEPRLVHTSADHPGSSVNLKEFKELSHTIIPLYEKDVNCRERYWERHTNKKDSKPSTTMETNKQQIIGKERKKNLKKVYSKKRCLRVHPETLSFVGNVSSESSSDSSASWIRFPVKRRHIHPRRKNRTPSFNSEKRTDEKKLESDEVFLTNKDSGMGSSLHCLLSCSTNDFLEMSKSSVSALDTPFSATEVLSHKSIEKSGQYFSRKKPASKTKTANKKKTRDPLKFTLLSSKSQITSMRRKHHKQIRNFFDDIKSQTLKSMVSELHIEHTDVQVFGLGSYFDRLNRGEPLSDRDRMQYEWLRLASFQHYTGNGNALSLARNGFYHDPTDGPTSTRCYLCETRHSTWEYFDNVEAEHRRRSPNCPFHANRNEESTNVSISYESSSQPPKVPPASTPSVNSTTTSSVMQTAPGIASSGTGSVTLAVREATRNMAQTQISSQNDEVRVYQPQENDENRQHSLLALPNSRPYRVLGRSGETAYSHLTTPPRRNNIATGAESNAGLDAVANSTATSTATSTTTSTFRPSSILGGPIGAGAFGGNASNPPPSSTAPTSSSVTSTTAIPRAVLSAKASLLTPTQPPIGSGGRTDPTITVVVNNPKHPDYRELDARINSFQGWPDYLDQTPRQMSEAGFFFVGVADFTRCFCCGGGLRNWEPGDDPMLEHTRWFPRCEYVNKLKGERYVAAVQRRHQEHMAEQQRQQQELAQRRDANRNPPDPMNTEAAAVLREMGYQQERIRDAILAVRQQIGVPDVTTQQVLAWLLDQHEGRSPPTSGRTSPTRDLGVKVNIVVTPSTTQTSTPSTVISTTATVSTATSTVLAGSTSTTTVSSTSTATGGGNQQSGSSTSVTSSTEAGSKPASQTGSSVNEASEGSNVDKQSAAARGESDEEEFKSAEETPSADVKSTGKKKSKKKTKTKGGSKSTGASGGPVDAKTLKEENEKLREMQTCKICMERPVNTTLLPCGHLVCCDICAGRLNRCPICRKRIQGTVKTFMS